MAENELSHTITTNALLAEIARKTSTRDDVATLYRLVMSAPLKTDWTAVHHAIILRWSRSALKYIKQQAWKEQQ